MLPVHLLNRAANKFVLSWGVRQQPCRIGGWAICCFRRRAADDKFWMILLLLQFDEIICPAYESIIFFVGRGPYDKALLPLDCALRLAIRIIDFLMLHSDYRGIAPIYLARYHRSLWICAVQARVLLLWAVQLPHMLRLLRWHRHELLVLHIMLHGIRVKHLHSAGVVLLLRLVAAILDPHLLLPTL